MSSTRTSTVLTASALALALTAALATVATPAAAIDALAALHAHAISALRGALDRFFDTGTPPSPEARAHFRYPELRVTYAPQGVMPTSHRRAYAKFQGP